MLDSDKFSDIVDIIINEHGNNTVPAKKDRMALRNNRDTDKSDASTNSNNSEDSHNKAKTKAVSSAFKDHSDDLIGSTLLDPVNTSAGMNSTQREKIDVQSLDVKKEQLEDVTRNAAAAAVHRNLQMLNL